jgi:hypothetical protein
MLQKLSCNRKAWLKPMFDGINVLEKHVYTIKHLSLLLLLPNADPVLCDKPALRYAI